MFGAFLLIRRRNQGELLRMRGHRLRLTKAGMFHGIFGVAIWTDHGSHLRLDPSFNRRRPAGDQRKIQMARIKNAGTSPAAPSCLLAIRDFQHIFTLL